MVVSPICVKDGKKFAYIEFKDEKRKAEGIIPTCEIVSNEGFSEEETAALIYYMKTNLSDLKKMAAGLNAFSAMRK